MNYSLLIKKLRDRVELNAQSWKEAGLTLCPDRIQSEDYNPDGRSLGPFANYCHLLWMLDEAEKMVEPLSFILKADHVVMIPADRNSASVEMDAYINQISKLNRWVGFVQGTLWNMGMVSIEDLRQDVIESSSR